MKYTSLLLLKFAGFAGALLFTTSPSRAITAAVGDLVLGFRAGGGQGSGVNLEVNIGPASNYYNAALNSTFVVPGLSPQDLVNNYGSSWASRGNLSWGIAGTTGTSTTTGRPARTIWVTSAPSQPGVQATPDTSYNQANALTLQNASNAIVTLYVGAPGSLSNGSATANSLVSSEITASEGGSWTSQEDLVIGTSFRRFTPSVRNSMDMIPGTPAVYDGLNGYGVLDLIEITPGSPSNPGSYLGTFGLNSNGQLVFSRGNAGAFAPIPEPAATLTLAGVFAALLLRRRR